MILMGGITTQVLILRIVVQLLPPRSIVLLVHSRVDELRLDNLLGEGRLQQYARAAPSWWTIIARSFRNNLMRLVRHHMLCSIDRVASKL